MTVAPFEIDLDAIRGLPAEDQQKAFAHVAALKRRLEGNPLWGYVPHDAGGTGGQVRFHEASREQIFLAAVVAGNRFGKTHAGVVDCLIQLLPDEQLPPWLQSFRRRPYTGDYRCRSVGVDLPQWLTKVMLPKVRALVPPAALHKGNWANAYNDRNRILTFADGSWWDFLTHDMDIDAFAGAELDRVHFDEEPPGEKGKLQYDESLARLIDRDGDARFTMTPLLGLSWVYYELTTDDQPRDDDEVRVITGEMSQNPHLSVKMQDRLRKRWEKEPLKLEARMKGRFVHFEGLVYDEFREDQHVVPDRPVPRRDEKSRPSVPIYAAIDPGIDHPAGLVFFWLDENDVAEVFYAEKFRDSIVRDIAARWHDVCTSLDVRPRWTVIDPAARNRSPQTGRNIQQEFSEHGVHTLAGQNARAAGFDRVKERLRTDRLVIHASCQQLVDEFKNYRWKKPRTSQVEDAGVPAAVIKTNDDLLDALRYGLMSMPVKAAREVHDLEREEAQTLRLDIARRMRRPNHRIGGVTRV